MEHDIEEALGSGDFGGGEAWEIDARDWRCADADLIGCPVRLVVSKKSLAENSVEIKQRNQSESKLVPLTQIKEMLY